MPAFLGHWRIFEIAARAVQSDRTIGPALKAPGPTYRGFSQWAYLGAMGPDIPYFSPKPFGWLADAFHNKKTNVFVANFIEQLAQVSPSDDPYRRSIPDVGYTFILGFLCHMAGDLMLHPYVNAFGGLSDAKSLPVAASSMGHEANTHRYVEVMFDAYLAAKYFDAPHLSDQPGNRFFSSWSDFIGETISMEAGKLVPMNWLLGKIITAGNKTYPYGQKKGILTVPDARAGAKKMTGQVLDLVYDAALAYMPETATWEFVQHKWRDRRFEDYLDAAARVTVMFWHAAAKYRAACLRSPSSPSKDARKEFLKTVRNFNLDTGYTLRVYSDSGNIHIRYDHSWALYLRETGYQAVDMEYEDLAHAGKL